MNNVVKANSITALNLTWLILIAATLVSAFSAETRLQTRLVILMVGLTIVLKGQLVIDRLMGLRNCPRHIRWLMLSYFYFWVPLILLVSNWPGLVQRFTTL